MIAPLLFLLASTAAAANVVPLVDHHQHLLSPAAAALVNRTLPAVELPPDLAALLKQRLARWNDKAGLAELYTDDAVALSTESPGWLRGKTAVADYLGARFGHAYGIRPAAWSMSGSAARIAGYLTPAGDPSASFGYVYLDLRKVGEQWRIAGETPVRAGPGEAPLDAAGLVAMLDAAGIGRAVVLSNAYYFDDPAAAGSVADPLAAVRAENDWTAAQAARFPDRLVAFCSVNPLRDYAIAEIERCAASGHFKGLKLHFRGSGVDLLDPEHVRRVRAAFEAANRHRLPIIIHVRADSTYGRAQAEVLIEQLLPAAPDVTIQIAHLWGGESYSESALAAFAGAAASHPNLYFDVAEVALAAGHDPATLASIAAQMRRIGLSRILYGSDGPGFGNVPPAEAWQAFEEALPLTPAEFAAIAKNVAPYLRP